MSPRIEKVIEAAKARGEVLTKYFGQSIETTRKITAADFVTKADVESERAILDMLAAAFPEYAIRSEERGRIGKESAFVFAVDPLDGTNNFVLGIPNFSIPGYGCLNSSGCTCNFSCLRTRAKHHKGNLLWAENTRSTAGFEKKKH